MLRPWQLKRMQRETREASAAISRITSEDDYPHREAALYDRKVLNVTYGLAANRPPEDYMTRKGVQSAMYFATDTFALSAWTGTAWKSVTLT